MLKSWQNKIKLSCYRESDKQSFYLKGYPPHSDEWCKNNTGNQSAGGEGLMEMIKGFI